MQQKLTLQLEPELVEWLQQKARLLKEVTAGLEISLGEVAGLYLKQARRRELGPNINSPQENAVMDDLSSTSNQTAPVDHGITHQQASDIRRRFVEGQLQIVERVRAAIDNGVRAKEIAAASHLDASVISVVKNYGLVGKGRYILNPRYFDALDQALRERGF